MTRLRARLALFSILAIFLATAANALFMQERSRMTGMPSTAVSVTQFPFDKSSAQAYGQPEEAKGPKLHVALQRELGRRGYADQLRTGANGLRLAVLAYELDNALPLTGEPTEALLKRILFDLNQAPRGAFADRAELNQTLVIEAQKMLLGLGFFRGRVSGRVDALTSNAIKDFERHRGLAQTGRLTGETLLELINYSGQAIQMSDG
jgi:hypothetical protein